MQKAIDYVNLREVLSRLLRHPLLQNVNLEQAIQYAIDFMGMFCLPEMFTTKECVIEIDAHRGALPCDLIEILMVRTHCGHEPLRHMTSSFLDGHRGNRRELSYKTQGRVIYTSFECGEIDLSYKSIPVDDEGLPLLINHPKYLKALELYIKTQAFTVLFDQGDISATVLNHTEQEYAWAAGQLHTEMKMPSVAEMESFTRMMNQLLPRVNEFHTGFEHLGDRENWREHRG